MIKKRHKFLCFVIATALFCESVPVYADMVTMRLLYDGSMHDYKAESISIEINGALLAIEDMPPISLYDRTMVPARAVFEALGAEVVWNEPTQEVYIRKEKDIIILKIDQKTATKNGINFTLDVPAKVVNERTMIPVRAVSEALGCSVEWNENTRTVSITEKQQPLEEENESAEQQQPEEEKEQPKKEEEQKPKEENYASGGTGEIPKENIGIIDVTVPSSEDAEQIFKIMAKEDIAKFEEVAGKENEIILDIYYAQKEILTDDKKVTTSPFVESILSSEFDKEDEKGNDITITRIVFELSKEANYTILSKKDTIEISFEEKTQTEDTPTAPQDSTGTNHDKPEYDTEIKVDTNQPNLLTNVSYDNAKKALALNKTELFAVENIEHKDDYLHGKYQILLPEDYSNTYGSGTMNLPNMEVPSVTLSVENGKTAITFTQNNIRAYTITEDANYYYIHIKNPKEVYDKVVLLDAGHGGQDPGTNGNGLKEKEINISILQKAYEKLQKTDKVKTYVTRIGDTYPENKKRAELANDMADMFLSIHMNSASPNPTPNGTEALFITHQTDVQGKLTSQAVATIVLKNMVNALGTNNRGLKYDTQEQKNLIVLNKTVVPAVIIETVFLSNPGDAKKISQEAYQEKAAQAIYDSIIELADNYVWR